MLFRSLDNNDIETLKTRINELEQAAAYMANAQKGQQSAGGESTPGSSPDDVVDADFSDKNKA